MLWNAKNGTVPLGNTEMHYASFGSGPKVLVLLPGLSDGLATVKGKAFLLSQPYKLFFEKYTVYMFSRKNEMPDGYSIRDMAEDQVLALKRLGIERFSVLGVSQGGMIAQYIAIDHHEMVEKLVIAVSAPSCSEIAAENVHRWLEFAEAGDHKSLMIDTAEKSYSSAYLAKYRSIYPIIGRIGKPSDGYRRFCINARAILGFDASEELCKISCPTFIIGGEEDKIVGAEASRRLNALIPGSSLFLYPDLGHAAYEEAKDFNKRIFEFLEA
ncbi:MAG: alpha/beta hydrolase [Firmicutes bacterium]|nr:alpha/beta hydrolase [Bacillota bacterium]